MEGEEELERGEVCLGRGPRWERGAEKVAFFKVEENNLVGTDKSSEEVRLVKTEKLLGEKK